MKNFPSIKSNNDFRIVYRNGKRKSSGSITMTVMPNGMSENRIGISISHREGNSVIRHRFIRRMREIFRTTDLQTVQGNDIVITARNGAGTASFDTLKKEYLMLLSIHKMI